MLKPRFIALAPSFVVLTLSTIIPMSSLMPLTIHLKMKRSA